MSLTFVVFMIIILAIAGIFVLIDLAIKGLGYIILIIIVVTVFYYIYKLFKKIIGADYALVSFSIFCLLLIGLLGFGAYYNENKNPVWYTSVDTTAQYLNSDGYCVIPKDTMLIVIGKEKSAYVMGELPPTTLTCYYIENDIKHEVIVKKINAQYYGEIDIFGNVKK